MASAPEPVQMNYMFERARRASFMDMPRDRFTDVNSSVLAMVSNAKTQKKKKLTEP
jgi:hypothetical protein